MSVNTQSAAQLVAANPDYELTKVFAQGLPAVDQSAVAAGLAALKAKGYNVIETSTKADALAALKTIAPNGASVYQGHSTSLEEVGYIDYLKHSNDHVNLMAAILAEPDMGKQSEMRRKAVLADYFFTSVNAVGSDGTLAAVDLTGTRTSGFIATSKNLVLLVSPNKFVNGGIKECIDRIEKVAVPMESLRAHLAYGVPASSASNWVFISGDNPFSPVKRIHIIYCAETLGY